MRKVALTVVWLLIAGVARGLVLTPVALKSALSTTNQGALVGLAGVDPLSCPQVVMSQAWSGGKLIFSDSPESPVARGILYADTNLAAITAGTPNRIFVYHVNSNSAARMKFSVLVKNNGGAAGTLTVAQSGLAGPSTDYPLVGQLAYYRWMTNAPGGGTTVPAGATVRLDTTFDSLSVQKGFLVNGIWDYSFTQPHSVIVCALNTADDPVSVGPTLAVLARDVHVRGTFSACNKVYNTATNVVIDTAAGMEQFPIAGNGDVFVTGFDNAVATPTAETDGGNYGVLYRMALATKASDGNDEAFLITPRGGAWCGAMNVPAGLLPGGAVLLPPNGAAFSDETEAVLAGEYHPGGGQTVNLQFMPTGGVSFPVRLMAAAFTAIAPVLGAIGNFTVNAGQTVAFTATATDANTNKTLTFSMASGPAGASVAAGSGVFSWRPPVASAGTSNVTRITVADNSTPPLTNSRSFLIFVNPLAPVTVLAAGLTNGQFQLQVAGMGGPDYILQANATAADRNGWVNLTTNTPGASPFILTDTNTGNFSNRFYRVMLGP